MKTKFLQTGYSLRHLSFVIGITLAGALFALIRPMEGHAQCQNGEVLFQFVDTNMTRCGFEGNGTNDTYYRAKEIIDFTISTLYSDGTATFSNYTYQVELGPTNALGCDTNPCSNTQTAAWAVDIPFNYSHSPPGCSHTLSAPCSCNSSLTNCPTTCPYVTDCQRLFGSWFIDLEGIPYFLCTSSTLPENPYVIVHERSHSVEHIEVQTEYGGLGAEDICVGMNTFIHKETWIGPYTLQEFASDALAAAKAMDWTAGNLGGGLIFWPGRKCVNVSLTRAAVKFKSKKGVINHVTAKIQLNYLAPTYHTNVVEIRWSGMGDGTEMVTPWIPLPDPDVDDSYTAEVLEVSVRTEDEDGDGDGERACGTCDEDDDEPGNGKDYIDSAAFFISMGAGAVDDSAGILLMDEETPSANMATPAALQFLVNTNVVTVVTNGDGTIHLAAPTMLARVEATNSYAYWVHCSAVSGSAYDTNNPFISHLVINPNGSTNFNTLRHIKFRGSAAITNEFVCETNTMTNITWSLVSGNGLKGERLTKMFYTNETRLETYTVFNPANSQELYRRERLYWALPYGDRLLSQTIDPAGLALTTTNTYNSSGNLLQKVRHDGTWERREYYTNGLLWRIITPFTNQPPTASADVCRVTEYDYNAVSGSPESSVNVWKSRPRTIKEYVRGEVVSKTMHAYGTQYDFWTQTSDNPSAAWDDAGNEKSYQAQDTEYRVYYMDHANGTRTTIAYNDDPGDGSRTTVNHSGYHNGSSFQQGTKTETKVDGNGRMVFHKTYDIASGNILTSHDAYSDPDMFGRPTKITYLDGSTSINVKQDCCQAAYTVDRDGVTNTFAYDALNRLVATARLGITTSNILDAAGRLLSETRKGTDGSLITLRRLGYDGAKRIIRETNALNFVTSFAYLVDTNSQRVFTVTNADGGTRIETYFRDGHLASVTGTAAFPLRYEYGREFEDGYQRPYTKEIKLDLSGNDTPEWSKTFSDGMGRGYKTVFPGSATNQLWFNNKGQLWKERDPDGVVRLFTNNALGDRSYTVIDSNRNDVIDFAGLDRITETTNDVLAAHSTNVRRARTYVWLANGSSTGTLLSTVETSVDGLKTWTDLAGAASSSVRTIPSSGSYTVTHTKPGGAYDISLYQNGRLTSVTQYDSGGGQVGKTTYGYDAHGRQSTVTDARNGTTTFVFNSLDQVVSLTTPSPGNGQSPQTTTTYFDPMGRATNIVHPDGASVQHVYSLRGELLRTIGSRTYPVGYAYDAQGRMKHMTNWSTYPSTGARVTAWNYDTQRGWLTNKVYADGLGPKYSYTAAGRLSSRLWARGTNTAYSYNNFGDLAGIDYSDSTPDVTYAYNRRGQQETISASDGNAWKLYWHLNGQLASERITGGVLQDYGVTNWFGSTGVRERLDVQQSTGYFITHHFTHDTAGRLSGIANTMYSVTYGFLANSPLIQQITFKNDGATKMTTTKAYDKLNRLQSISSQPTGAAQPATAFAYGHNNANQRVKVHTGDGAYWLYEYDNLGQVVSGKKFWDDHTPVAGQQFDYRFDDIGNRTSTKAGGDASGSAQRSASYSANSLNQITQRDVPAAMDVIGAATATATNVNVNDYAAFRRSEYYQHALSINNASAPQWQAVTNRAVQNGTTNLITGNIFLPKTPEIFSYDADGNLTNDGRWSYTWDAENRLVRLVANTAVGPQQRIDFSYDWRSRRIVKKVWNNTGGTGSPASENRFLYDGWNVVAILNGANSTQLSFTWGTDLSGTSQGAGGVGGLLSMLVHTGTNAGTMYFYACDGNGNVAALVSATDGTVAAQYAYGPFGEVIRATGALATANPFGFSTKYQDDESDLLYYGFRFYNASIGRWLNRDPIQEEGGYNLYGFCENDGIARLDHLGLNDLALCGPMMTGETDWYFPSELQAELSLLMAALLTPVPGDEGIAAAALLARLEKLLNKCAKCFKWRCVVRWHGKHHPFDGVKKCHLEFQCYVRGQRGTPKKWYVPLPDALCPPGTKK